MKKNCSCLAIRTKNSFIVYLGFAETENHWFTKKRILIRMKSKKRRMKRRMPMKCLSLYTATF